MSRVVIFSTGVVRERLIGPEIRVWEIARNLTKKGHTVTLAVPNADFPANTPFKIVQYGSDNMKIITEGKDVAVLQGEIFNKFMQSGTSIPIVCDLYDPYIVECLHLDPKAYPSAVQKLKTQLLGGDFFLCASESQRLFYLGMLAALGKLDHARFAEFTQFENIIDIVPFGASSENLSFARCRSSSNETTIFLGGVYTWYDPFVCLDGLKLLVATRKDIRFLFIRFPFVIPPIQETEQKVLQYASRIGVADHIIFDEWVPYEERSRLYERIDIALVIHKTTLESILSFRTRVLDFLSFGVPVITNKGGDLEKMIEDRSSGIVIEELSPEAIAKAVIQLKENQRECDEIVERGRSLIRDCFLWENVIAPLDRYCRSASETAAGARKHLSKDLLSPVIEPSDINPPEYLQLLDTYLEGAKGTWYYEGILNCHIDIGRFFGWIDYIEQFGKIDGQRTLDVGCGSGGMLLALHQQGASEVHGVEVDVSLYELCNLRVMPFPNVQVHFGNGSQLPFEDCSFDVITSIHVVEHVGDVRTFFSEIFRVLKKGGECLIECPNRLFPLEPHNNIPLIPYMPKGVADVLCSRLLSRFPYFSPDHRLRLKNVASFSHFLSPRRIQQEIRQFGGQIFLMNPVERFLGETFMKSMPKTPFLVKLLSRYFSRNVMVIFKK